VRPRAGEPRLILGSRSAVIMTRPRRRDPDSDDFESWFRHHASLLYQYAYWFCREGPLAEDVAADAALNIYKAWSNDQQRILIRAHRGYVYRIVKHAYLDFAKVPSRVGEGECALADDAGGSVLSSGTTTDLAIDTREVIRRHLDTEELDIVFLRYYQDLSFKEIARCLGIPQRQVYRAHDRIKQKLRPLFSE